MKREVGATTVLAALLLVVGAILLSCQWPIERGQALALSHPLYLIAELGLYLVLLMAIDRGLVAAGYLLGGVGALGTRIAIGFASAGFEYWQVGGPYDVLLYPAIFSLPRVAIAMLAAGVALMLLRDVLPQRPRPAPRPQAQSAQGEAAPAPKLAFDSGPLPESKTERPSEIMFIDQKPPPLPTEPPEPRFEGEVELPLSLLLRDAPEGLEPAQGRADAVVQIPVALIGPQLKEGRVVLSAAQLEELAPRGALASGELDPETEVPLPLDAIVPALPPGTLDLGPPLPPSWQCELEEESEEALFSAG